MLTCSVDVKVGGLVGHVASGLQAWSSSVHLVRVTHGFSHVHCVGALVNVLSSKQHFHLGGNHEKNLGKISLKTITIERLWYIMMMRTMKVFVGYLVDSPNLWHVGDSVGSILVIVGHHFSLE